MYRQQEKSNSDSLCNLTFQDVRGFFRYIYTLVFLVITETKLSKVWSMVGHEKAEKAQKKKGRCDFFFYYFKLPQL